MKYLDDLRILLLERFPDRLVFLENFANEEDTINQIVLASEPSAIDIQLPFCSFNFSVYVQNQNQQKAYDIANDILLYLNNRSFLGASEVNLFNSISAVATPYYFSNGGRHPIYLTKYTARVTDKEIVTYQYDSNQKTI